MEKSTRRCLVLTQQSRTKAATPFLRGVGGRDLRSAIFRSYVGITEINKLPLEFIVQDYQAVEEVCALFYYSGKDWGFDLTGGLKVLNKYAVSDVGKGTCVLPTCDR